jgi:WS/DGAT/MGAT family acyltransferase
MRQLSGLDAMFLYNETPNAPQHVAFILIYDPSTAPDGKVTHKGVLDTIQQRLPRTHSFRQRLVRVPLDLDHPYWVEGGEFDLEYHVRHIALPQPGDWRQLSILLARLQSRPLDLTRPLWELYIIEGLDDVEGVPKGGFAMLLKVHHAAIDGVGGVEAISALHDASPEASVAPDTTVNGDWKPERDPSPMQLLARANINNMMRPMHMARVIIRTQPGLRRLQRQVRRRELQLPSTAAPRTRFNGTISAHRVFVGCPLPLADFRRIKDTVAGSTINDVLVSVIGGAMRQYLAAKGELPSEPLVAMAPISVRAPEESGAAGNQVSAMTVSLCTHIADPLERLSAVRESTRQSKALVNAVGARELSGFSQFVPGALMGQSNRMAARLELANRTNPVVNTVVSNVPGPQEPLYFAGARVVSMMGMGNIVNGMGLIQGATSYCGEIAICATACREMLPDPSSYTDMLRASFKETLSAVS